MLATGLLILKWIGIILLGILGLVLTLILLVLFVPIRYRAKGSCDAELSAEASVSWLLHILSLGVAYDGELNVAIRIFGIRLKSREKMSSADFNENFNEKSVEAVTLAEPAATHEAEPSQRRKAGKKPAKSKKRRKFSFSFHQIYDKLKEVKEQKDKVWEFLEKKDNQASFRLVWKQFKALLKHILPTQVKGKIRFGFADPYTTGQVLMYISPFYGMYAKMLTIIPVFEEPVIEGTLSVRGRVRIGLVLFRICLLALNKNNRTLWRKLMNH